MAPRWLLLAWMAAVCIDADDTKRNRAYYRKENKEVRKLMPLHPDSYLERNGKLPIVDSLPRLSPADLKLPENKDFLRRERPFILTGAMEGWPAMEKWRVNDNADALNSYLAQTFADQVSDYYPYNMMKSGTHPYLYYFGPGLEDALNPPGNFERDPSKKLACSEGCRYLHLQLTPKAWEILEERGDMPLGPERHKHTLGGDAWWMKRCMANQPEVQEEFHLKTHWKIILIGTRGAGMFNHSDSLQTSSWHGHVQGRKWWYICSPNGGHKCYESVLQEGEVLYYGPGWSHHTQNLDTPTMTVTSTVVVRSNFESVARKLHSECAYSAMSFDFSGQLCDALDKCYQTWYEVLKGKKAPHNWIRPWREDSSADNVRVKDKMDPAHNNYDGRNWIGGKERLAAQTKRTEL